MNKVYLIGRLTKDPETRYSNNLGVARYTLAVDRRGKKDEADFINCVTFDQGAAFAEKYLYKGIKIAVAGRLQTGSYTNKEGRKVYTTDVVVEEHEFVEKRTEQREEPAGEGFMDFNGDENGIPFA